MHAYGARCARLAGHTCGAAGARQARLPRRTARLRHGGGGMRRLVSWHPYLNDCSGDTIIHTDYLYYSTYKAYCCLVFSSTAEMFCLQGKQPLHSANTRQKATLYRIHPWVPEDLIPHICIRIRTQVGYIFCSVCHPRDCCVYKATSCLVFLSHVGIYRTRQSSTQNASSCVTVVTDSSDSSCST